VWLLEIPRPQLAALMLGEPMAPKITTGTAALLAG
jgi:hypothetical protein